MYWPPYINTPNASQYYWLTCPPYAHTPKLIQFDQWTLLSRSSLEYTAILPANITYLLTCPPYAHTPKLWHCGHLTLWLRSSPAHTAILPSRSGWLPLHFWNTMWCTYFSFPGVMIGSNWNWIKILLSCQPRVTLMSYFVYKVISDFESIDYLCINLIRRIGLIRQWSIDSR